MRVYYHPRKKRIVEHDGYSMRIFWSKQMLDDLRRLFPTSKNQDLAEYLGVSPRTVVRKAREMGLEKDQDWLTGVWDSHRRMAHMASRAQGYPGGFQKGIHSNPDGEFKRGHKTTPEQQAKRSESMRLWYRLHPSESRAKARKAWETRRERTKLQRYAAILEKEKEKGTEDHLRS